MTSGLQNPFRAAGTLSGPTYVERSADIALRAAIARNARYPYALAARQSGKSSLIARTTRELGSQDVLTASIDLSTFPPRALTDYGCLLWEFAVRLVRALGLETKFDAVLAGGFELDADQLVARIVDRTKRRIVVFLDEIDWLAGSNHRGAFFGLVRSWFNRRSTEPSFKQIQFVLVGAADISELIPHAHVSPFNVGENIQISDLTLKQARVLADHLRAGPWQVERVAERVYHYTKGSVYLSQVLLEALWDAGVLGGLESIGPDLVDELHDDVVSRAPQNVHFVSIHDSIARDESRRAAFAAMVGGLGTARSTGKVLRALRVTGVTTDGRVIRNLTYERVFLGEGVLALAGRERQLGMQRQRVRAFIEDAKTQGLTELSLDTEELTALPPSSGNWPPLSRYTSTVGISPLFRRKSAG